MGVWTLVTHGLETASIIVVIKMNIDWGYNFIGVSSGDIIKKDWSESGETETFAQRSTMQLGSNKYLGDGLAFSSEKFH